MARPQLLQVSGDAAAGTTRSAGTRVTPEQQRLLPEPESFSPPGRPRGTARAACSAPRSPKAETGHPGDEATARRRPLPLTKRGQDRSRRSPPGACAPRRDASPGAAHRAGRGCRARILLTPENCFKSTVTLGACPRLLESTRREEKQARRCEGEVRTGSASPQGPESPARTSVRGKDRRVRSGRGSGLLPRPAPRSRDPTTDTGPAPR